MARALNAAIQIIGIAALLGIGVLKFAIITPLPQDKRLQCFALHIAGAFIYTISWIAAVSFAGSVSTLISDGMFQFRLPGGPAFRWHLTAGPILYAAIVTAIFSVRSFERSQNLIKNAELQALRAKLNPHFIFNTLHTIMMLFRSDATKAEKAMEQFSDLIRYSFHGEMQTQNSEIQVSLADEWKIAEKYLELETLRLGDNLKTNIVIDEIAMKFLAPKLLLQPLIENAIIHGISGRENGTELKISIEKKAENVEINIENDYSTIESSHISGLGLKAVKAGLENLFGSNFIMTSDITSEGTYRVEIKMPAQEVPS